MDKAPLPYFHFFHTSNFHKPFDHATPYIIIFIYFITFCLFTTLPLLLTPGHYFHERPFPCCQRYLVNSQVPSGPHMNYSVHLSFSSPGLLLCITEFIVRIVMQQFTTVTKPLLLTCVKIPIISTTARALQKYAFIQLQVLRLVRIAFLCILGCKHNF